MELIRRIAEEIMKQLEATWLRGKEIKKVLVEVNAYSDECRELEFRVKYFLGDAYYEKLGYGQRKTARKRRIYTKGIGAGWSKIGLGIGTVLRTFSEV